MRVLFLFLLTCIMVSNVNAFKIDLGGTHDDSKLKAEIVDLKNENSRLKTKITILEAQLTNSQTVSVPQAKSVVPVSSWKCTIKKFNKRYIGTGTQKHLAANRAKNNCIEQNNGRDFHCNDESTCLEL
ncbi:hypothetical protein OAB57_01070 [Bacteriovoracaceae bacterium]|nr:hypothetical protein [Bacteriovoracaceae bacterium]